MTILCTLHTYIQIHIPPPPQPKWIGQMDKIGICKLYKCIVYTLAQCYGSGSVLDLYSGAFWVRICIWNTDPDQHIVKIG